MIDFKEIKNIMEDARKKYFTDNGIKTMDGIYYMNGNDGTSFDYEMNGNVCEFYIFNLDGDGLIKLYAKSDNTFTMYVYDYSDPFGGNYEEITGKLNLDVYILACHLQAEKDDKNIYDEVVDSWVLNDSVEFCCGEDEE